MTLDQYQRGQIKGYNVLGSTNNRHLRWISDLRQCSQPAHTSQYQHATCISTQVRYALDMFIWAVCICICVRMHPPFNDGNGECINKRKFRILLALQSATQPRVIHFHLYSNIDDHDYRVSLLSIKIIFPFTLCTPDIGLNFHYRGRRGCYPNRNKVIIIPIYPNEMRILHQIHLCKVSFDR